jgi:hypothetical protein
LPSSSDSAVSAFDTNARLPSSAPPSSDAIDLAFDADIRRNPVRLAFKADIPQTSSVGFSQLRSPTELSVHQHL